MGLDVLSPYAYLRIVWEVRLVCLRQLHIFYLIVLCVLIAGIAEAQSELTLSGIKGSINHQIGSSILETAYKKIGISVDTVEMPAKRSLVMVNAGDFDGEVQRIGNIDRHYPNLIVVPEPLLYLESSVFIKNSEIRIKGWEDLSPYTIGIPRGIMYLEHHTKGLNRIFVKSQDQLFDLLNTGRIDVVIISTNYGLSFLNKHKGMKIRMLVPPILKIPLYHYLHRKHRNLIPKIAESIRQMRISGEMDEIISQYRQDH